MDANLPTLPHEATTLDFSISKNDQDVDVIWLLRFGKHKVRIHVQSNPYNFQCHARSCVWRDADLSWSRVADIPFGEMATPTTLYARQDWDDASRFMEDCKRLLKLTADILL